MSKSIGKRIFQHSFRNDIDLFAKGILQIILEISQSKQANLALLEESVSKMGALSTSVEKLALSMESMVKEQEKQGKRLETLESRDGELWRKAVGYVVTAIIGAFLGYVFTLIGF